MKQLLKRLACLILGHNFPRERVKVAGYDLFATLVDHVCTRCGFDFLEQEKGEDE